MASDPHVETGRLRVTRGNRGTTELIHRHLREQILSGSIPAGVQLSQAQVAKDYGVSRGPIREAFRFLEREGLIESEINHRARVTSLSLPDIEGFYALRVLNEALALSVSVPLFTPSELDEMDVMVAAVESSKSLGFAAWEQQHQRFHALLLAHAGDRMQGFLGQWAEHTERYRRVYVADDLGGWSLGAAEHGQLADACRQRDVGSATRLLARHLSRAGFTLIATMDPEYDSKLLRAAIQHVVKPSDLLTLDGPAGRFKPKR